MLDPLAACGCGRPLVSDHGPGAAACRAEPVPTALRAPACVPGAAPLPRAGMGCQGAPLSWQLGRQVLWRPVFLLSLPGAAAQSGLVSLLRPVPEQLP